MSVANQIIHEILSTGAKFTLSGDEVGLTQVVDDELLERARKHKTQIKQILEAVKRQNRIAKPKVWTLKIQSLDGKTTNSMTMIDPHRMSEPECKIHLARQFGASRVLEFREVVK